MSGPADNAAHYSHTEKSATAILLEEMQRLHEAQQQRHRRLMLMIAFWMILSVILSAVLVFT